MNRKKAMCVSEAKNRLVMILLLISAALGGGCMTSDASEPVAEESQRVVVLESRIDSLQRWNAELEDEARLKHEFLDAYVKLVNQTLRDLEAITAREGMIRQVRLEMEAGDGADGGAGSIEQRIQDNLAALDQYITENKKQREALARQRAELSRHAHARTVDVSGYQQTIKRLGVLLEEKEATIRSLRQEARHMLGRLNDLRQQNTVLVEENTVLRAAYYAVGTREALMDKDIIDRRGGFLRMGRKTRIDQLDAAHFTETTVESAEVYVGRDVEKYQVLSNHRTHPDLYRFEQRADGIYVKIIDPDKFWNVSRYLIVEVK